ncbi:MAG: uncharacterized protein PWR24_262 [Desulfonauticus sp.]|jgi:hypothetical protein|nr:uncharacterized protein [Desulfonauticus sp.]
MAKKKKTRKKTQRKKHSFSLILLSLLLFVLAISLYKAYQYLDLPPKKYSFSQKQKINTTPTNIKNTPQNNHLEYEEEVKNDFILKLKEVDLIIIQSLYTNHGQKVKITSHNYKDRYLDNISFKLQELSLYVSNPAKFISNLKKNIKKLTPFASIRKVEPQTYYLTINNILTHIIYLEEYLPKTVTQGKLVIVIDDMGRSVPLANKLLSLPLKLTFSFLPYAPHSREIATKTHLKNQGVMLHLPMEPQGYPQKANPGPGALFTFMDLMGIEQTCLQDLAKVPYVKGVNNHMGSRFTEYKPGMKKVFSILKRKNLFFLDSLTTPKSVTTLLAQQMGIKLLKRDIFLDNVQDEKSILFQLKKAEALALKKGTAIAIGHPYEETFKALQKWSQEKSPQVKTILVEELL